jgi:addiction module RelE/StbE family toxin
MRRTLLSTKGFERGLRRYLKTHPSAIGQVRAILDALAEDAFLPTLKTHKLKGDLVGSWAASAGYDLRIIFHFDQENGAEVIRLEAVGSHDQVY